MNDCKVCKEEISKGRAEGSGMCRKCWRRDHTKKNKDKIRKQHTIRYLKDREKNIKQSDDWRKSNLDYVAKKRREYYQKKKEEEQISAKTRHYFSHLKKDAVCQICGSKKKLEFHHFRPYKYDKFIIVCFNCHRFIEKRLLVADPKNGGKCMKKRQGEQHE